MALSFPIDLLSDAIEIAIRKKNELYENLDNLTQPIETEQTTKNFVIIGRGRGRGRGRSQATTGHDDVNDEQSAQSSNIRRGRGRGRGRGGQTEDANLLKSNLEEFFDYFVKQWFEGSIDYEMWNHATTDGPRTNNHVEGFHFKINSWIDKNHPSVYNLVKFF